MLLFGIRFMSDGLQAAAGEKLRKLLGKLTTNPILAVLTGAIVTAGVQSSSSTTVMVVGLVNAGMMTLPQAIGVIMGANIGTSFTAQLIALDLGEFAYPLIGVGALLWLFAERRVPKNIGQCILGFGILFAGLTVMQEAVHPLRDLASFQNLMLVMRDHPLYGVFAGVGMTVVLQSSSGTIGILQGFAHQGIIDLVTALPVLIGDNIGTTVTALIASIGTSLTARRAAVSHTLFNLVGAFIFFATMPFLVGFIANTSPSAMRQLANAHSIFNVMNMVIQLPFIYLFARMVTYLVPGEVVELKRGPQYISDSLLSAPEVAMQQVRRELVRMMSLAMESLDDAMKGFLENDRQAIKNSFDKESVVNELETEVTRYLVRLSQTSMTTPHSRELNALLNFTNDIERVGDHAENIAEMAEEKIDNRLPFSEQAVSDLNRIYGRVVDILTKARSQLDDYQNEAIANCIVEIEEEIDQMEETLRRRHIERLNSGRCYPESGVLFLDLISNLERVADHASSIAHISLDTIKK